MWESTFHWNQTFNLNNNKRPKMFRFYFAYFKGEVLHTFENRACAIIIRTLAEKPSYHG